MALDPEARYPSQVDPASTAYPYGSARNITAPSADDGTPWDEDLINDIFGFQQALLKTAGLTPNGSPDTAEASQYLSAILALLSSAGGRQNGQITTTGSGGNYALALPDPVTSYQDGLSVRFIANHSVSGGTAALDVDGVGPAAIVNPDGSAPVFLTANGVYDVSYNEAISKFVLLGSFSTLAGTRVAQATTTARGTLETATAAEAIARASTAVGLTPKNLADVGAITDEDIFTSDPQSFANATVLSLEHNLGQRPRQFDVYARCINAVAGYAVGEETKMSLAWYNDNEERGIGVSADDTFIHAIITSPRAYSKSSPGNTIGINATDWRLILRAIK